MRDVMRMATAWYGTGIGGGGGGGGGGKRTIGAEGDGGGGGNGDCDDCKTSIKGGVTSCYYVLLSSWYTK